MKLIGKISSYDKIVAHLKKPRGVASELTAHEEHMLERWQKAYSLIRNYTVRGEAAAIMMKLYPEISRATAFRDVANAISLFGNISETTKEGIRHMAGEMIAEGFALAKIKNNEVAMIAAGEKYANVHGVNSNDPDIPDFDKIEPHTYEISLPPNAIAALQAMVSNGAISLGGLVNEMGKHAEEAQIVNEEEQEDAE